MESTKPTGKKSSIEFANIT
jgi:hypothetical protein